MTNTDNIVAGILTMLFALGIMTLSTAAFSNSAESNCVGTHDFETMTEDEIHEIYEN